MAKGKYKKWIDPDGLIVLKTWARLGLTDKDIAANMDINVSTLYEWKNKYSELAEALTYAKAEADAIVENALYKRAVGYKYDEVTQERRKNDDGTYNLVTTKIVTKMVVPDTTAQIFWLKNRNQNRWRDKVESKDITNTELLDQLRKTSENYR